MVKQFNDSQKKAIAHLDGPMMVLAGPGSGKTSVIVQRTAELVRKGVPADRILVVTFTRAAAREMKERFLALCRGKEESHKMGTKAVSLTDKRVRSASSAVTFGTFHGVFYGILKQTYALGPENILSEEEKMGILRELAMNADARWSGDRDFLEEISREISLVKGERIALSNYYSASCADEVFREIYRGYSAMLRQKRKLDFDDILLSCQRLLLERREVLERWQRKFCYVLVDEFQDISRIQYDTIRLLAAPQDNLFIVGDDDQSIYHFRGADPKLMMDFQKDYPGCGRILLDTNYRCSANILDCGLRVISENRKRFPKKLATPKSAGEVVKTLEFENPGQEYRFLAQELRSFMEKGESLSDKAVLFRTNQESEGLVRTLLEYQVPFVLQEQPPDLFRHWICEDLLAYMHLASGDFTRRAFLRIMNRPNRYFSREAAEAAGKDPEKLLAFYRGKDWMEDRVQTLYTHLHILSTLPPFAAVNFIRKGMKYEEYLQEYARYRKMKAEELLEVLDRLQESARETKRLEDWEQKMAEYQEELSRHQGVKTETAEGVALSTLHRAKGLEFRKVYIVNVNEGNIPYRKAVLPEDLEEERRLFYVGITRASEDLYLLRVKKQYEKKMEPSRFLLEAGYA